MRNGQNQRQVCGNAGGVKSLVFSFLNSKIIEKVLNVFVSKVIVILQKAIHNIYIHNFIDTYFYFLDVKTDDEIILFCIDMLNRLIETLGEIEALPIISKNVKTLVKSGDWKQRAIALICYS